MCRSTMDEDDDDDDDDDGFDNRNGIWHPSSYGMCSMIMVRSTHNVHNDT